MPALVRAAVGLMFAALALYSAGVWGSVAAGQLKPWHVVAYWAGFLCDVAGTEIMRRLAGGLHWSLHTASGALALALMLGHACWASRVITRRESRELRAFPRFSITVWVLWLIPFGTGLLLGGRRGF